MAVLALTNNASEQPGPAEEFATPSSRKRARNSNGQFAHEDSEEQFVGMYSNLNSAGPYINVSTAAELAVNGDTVKRTVAAANAAVTACPYQDTIGSLRMEESDIRSRLAFCNAQLRYQLNHREYLIQDLRRIMDSQHQRSEASSSSQPA